MEGGTAAHTASATSAAELRISSRTADSRCSSAAMRRDTSARELRSGVSAAAAAAVAKVLTPRPPLLLAEPGAVAADAAATAAAVAVASCRLRISSGLAELVSAREGEARCEAHCAAGGALPAAPGISVTGLKDASCELLLLEREPAGGSRVGVGGRVTGVVRVAIVAYCG